MADVYCVRCGEPWDMDTLHEEIEYRYPDRPWEDESNYEEYFSKINREFHEKGCQAITSYEVGPCLPASESQKMRGSISSMLYEMLGDDIDGIAASLEDAEYLGIFD